MEILETRIDGSFVITKNGMPYQAIPGMEEWNSLCTASGVDPVAQAAIYTAAHQPQEPPEAEPAEMV